LQGIKASDAILKKFPDHGETLAMKGLTLNCMNKKEEAHEFVKKGLRNDMKSHVCWHVYGLLHRSERNYQQAIKCYLQALKIKTDDQQIMRDLSLLQIQMRNLGGYVSTRRSLLTLKPQNRNNWISFCIAHHMNGSHTQALKIMDAYLKTLEEKRKTTYEDSEMMLYKAQLYEEGGQKKEALDHLNNPAVERLIMDKLGMNVVKGRLLLELGEWDEAEKVYLNLLEINPEQYGYHCGYQCAVLKTAEFAGLDKCNLPVNTSASLTQEQREDLSSRYEAFQEKEPKCNAHARIALHLGLVYAEGAGSASVLPFLSRPFSAVLPISHRHPPPPPIYRFT
jgi:peptide alpha-N-acetyltransferase